LRVYVTQCLHRDFGSFTFMTDRQQRFDRKMSKLKILLGCP